MLKIWDIFFCEMSNYFIWIITEVSDDYYWIICLFSENGWLDIGEYYTHWKWNKTILLWSIQDVKQIDDCFKLH